MFREGADDWGEWHKDRLRRTAYTMDADGVEWRRQNNIEYRRGANDGLEVVGFYELILCPQNVERVLEDPGRWAIHPGKLGVLKLLKRAFASAAGRAVPVFIVWRPPRMKGAEFLVSECEGENANRLTEDEFVALLEGLPDWPWPLDPSL